ncbi:metallophosphoesterase [Pseudomonas capsici]|uniref:metallophosphoesterase n=1 Tax=Pseudomonas capsici TaxID=2810614 RepID=UPI0021F17F48|nr:metallophosphoesterase [Pseudomonas capsici]MCV4343301.1 metallophosphoesterase [Pseudomonas capsici]
MSLIKRFERNAAGRDFAVGDIHGHFTRLQSALDAVGFDPKADRLFSVGDLVDRGPECEDVVKWLNKPWFHPVRGNHDDYVCRFDTCDIGNWMHNGGAWFLGLPSLEQANYQIMFNELPIAIEVDTAEGLIGLVHADCPFPSWDALRTELSGSQEGKRAKLVRNTCMWSRSRIEQGDESGVSGIRALVCGHTPLSHPAVLGNVYHIDTGGWLPDGSGYFTLLNLSSLQTVPPMSAKLEWVDA